MARTISEYIIMRWIEANFQPGSLKVQVEGNSAKIIDKDGDTAVLICDKDTREVYMLDE